MEMKAKRYRVTLRRSNGRFVREFTGLSKYAAKLRKGYLEDKHGSSYYVEINVDEEYVNNEVS